MALVHIAPPPVADAILQALLASFNIPVGAIIDDALLGLSLERMRIIQHTQRATQAECGAAEAYPHQLISIASMAFSLLLEMFFQYDLCLSITYCNYHSFLVGSSIAMPQLLLVSSLMMDGGQQV